MPETITNYSLDKTIYKLTNAFSKKNCYLNPNHITTLNIFISFYILYSLYHRYSMTTILMLFLIRSVLDILDGSVARMCNKTTVFGYKLDTLSDIVSRMLLLLLIIYVLLIERDGNNQTLMKKICNNWHKHTSNMKVTIMIILILTVYHIYLFYVYSTNIYKNDSSFISEHTVIMGLIVGYVVRKYLIT